MIWEFLPIKFKLLLLSVRLDPKLRFPATFKFPDVRLIGEETVKLLANAFPVICGFCDAGIIVLSLLKGNEPAFQFEGVFQLLFPTELLKVKS